MDLLWGREERPGRGPKPSLTLERIVQSGVALADKGGVRAVTMDRVADALGVTTMALYRYLPGKEPLIDAMLQAALGEPPPVEPADWRGSLERWARADRAVFEAHPWLLDLVPCTPIGPKWLAWLEAGLQSVSQTGLAPNEMLAAVSVVDGYVRYDAQMERGCAMHDPRYKASAEEWRACFARVLERVIADDHFPILSGLVASGAFDQPGDQFEFRLQRVLDGLGALIAQRAAAVV